MPVIAGSRHISTAITWKPVAATATATTWWIGLATRPSPLLLSIAAAAVAATIAYLLDDPAAATLQPSPTTLLRRRAHRVALTVPPLALWWAVTTTIVSRSTPQLPLTAHTLQFATLACIGLAGSSIASKAAGGSTHAGTAGALAVIVSIGTGFLPASSLQLVPVDPAAAASSRRLGVLLIVALALLVGGSLDPARRLVNRRGRHRRRCGLIGPR